MMGVLTHVIGDALNNIGVIIAALVIWQAKYEARFYADPGVGLGIAVMIFASAIPLGASFPLYFFSVSLDITGWNVMS